MLLWGYVRRGWAERMWERWYRWAVRSRLEPIKRVARMIKKHWEGVIHAATTGRTRRKTSALEEFQALRSPPKPGSARLRARPTARAPFAELAAPATSSHDAEAQEGHQSRDEGSGLGQGDVDSGDVATAQHNGTGLCLMPFPTSMIPLWGRFSHELDPTPVTRVRQSPCSGSANGDAV